MKIYFVRHGESEGNALGKRQGPASKLTEKGVKQAEIVAKRVKKIEFEHILSSTMERAKQTAEIINSAVDKPITFSDLFRERKNPSEFIGQAPNSSDVMRIYEEMNSHNDEPDWHYSDEENFYDLKRRGLEALEYLKSLPHESVLVVTHGVFMRMLVAVAVYGDKLNFGIYWPMVMSLKTLNTGITVLETKNLQESPVSQPEWALVTWNDHAHLGEIK